MALGVNDPFRGAIGVGVCMNMDVLSASLSRSMAGLVHVGQTASAGGLTAGESSTLHAWSLGRGTRQGDAVRRTGEQQAGNGSLAVSSCVVVIGLRPLPLRDRSDVVAPISLELVGLFLSADRRRAGAGAVSLPNTMRRSTRRRGRKRLDQLISSLCCCSCSLSRASCFLLSMALGSLGAALSSPPSSSSSLLIKSCMSALESVGWSSFVAGERVALATDRFVAFVGELAAMGDGRWARRCINALQRRVTCVVGRPCSRWLLKRPL